MIIGSLNNTEYYEENLLFQKAFEFLKNTDFSLMETGKIQLLGEDLFAIISNSDLRTEKEAKLEVHNKYVDIQIPISQSEVFGWCPRSLLKLEEGSFDKGKDIQFFEDDKHTLITVNPGDFIVFYPDDAHAPCIGEGQIRKVVVKINIQNI